MRIMAGKIFSYKKIAVLIVAGTLISKVSGFFREVLIGAKFGISYEVDAYLIAMMLPSILISALGAAITTTFIPVYTKLAVEKNKPLTKEFTNNVLNIVALLTIIISIFILLLAHVFVPLIAPGFTGEVLDLAIKLSRILSFIPLSLGISSVLVAYLQANNEFFLPAISGFLENLIIILFLVLMSTSSIILLAIATVSGIMLRLLIQIITSLRKGYKYSFGFNLRDANMVKMMWLTIPVLIGVSIQQINILIDRILASNLNAGSISALNYANRLNLFVFGVFSMSFATAVYPSFSKLFANRNYDKFAETVQSSINIISLLILPISAAAIILRKPIIMLVFKRGAFDEKAVQLTSIALMYYSIGMVGFALRDVLSRVFYAMQDTKIPMVNGALTVAINIALNIILVKYLYHGGLALATSISGIIGTLLLFYSLYNRYDNINFKKIVIELFKMIICTFIMSIFIYFIQMFLDQIIISNSKLYILLKLFISCVFGSASYLILAVVLKVEELQQMIVIVKKLKNR